MDVKTLLDNDRFARETGIRLVSCAPGEAVMEVELSEKHLNANSVAQGGLIFTLADTSFAVASNAGGRDAVSLGCTINFFRPGTGTKLTARASLVSQTKSTCCYDVLVTDDKGRKVAKMQCTGYFVG